MPIILDGRKARDSYEMKLAARVAAIKAASGETPKLALIQIGDNARSAVYIAQKKRFAADIGVDVAHIHLSADVSQADIVAKIGELDSDASIHGIIVQQPVPTHLDPIALMNAVDLAKDVDGLADGTKYIPATAKGIMLLLDFYKIDPKGKKAVVLGRSRLVGAPIARLLAARGASVTVCNSKTENVPQIAETANILVAAVGKPKLVDAEYIGANDTVVIDVGINRVGAELVGDVDFDDVASSVGAITPVPGGVGPMTVLALFDNLVVSAESRLTSALQKSA